MFWFNLHRWFAVCWIPTKVKPIISPILS
jgi:hypothetical protein